MKTFENINAEINDIIITLTKDEYETYIKWKSDLSHEITKY